VRAMQNPSAQAPVTRPSGQKGSRLESKESLFLFCKHGALTSRQGGHCDDSVLLSLERAWAVGNMHMLKMASTSCCAVEMST
jgi:hypothetical protein